MEKAIYDTKEGIESMLMLGSYEDFYAVMRKRYEVGNSESKDRERLNIFYVLGRFVTDEFGQCGKLNRKILTKEIYSALPPVLTTVEFFQELGKLLDSPADTKAFDLYEGVEGVALGFPLPPPHVLCSRCSKGWTFENCQDVDARGNFVNLPLGEFAGKILREAEAALNQRTDGAYEMHFAVRNDRWKNSDITQRLSRQEGWRSESDADHPITYDYVIHPGDEVQFTKYTYYHGECFLEFSSDEQKIELQEKMAELAVLFTACGFNGVKVMKGIFPHRFVLEAKEDGVDLSLDQDLLLWFEVETVEGEFGVGILGEFPPMMDLRGTGASMKALFGVMNPYEGTTGALKGMISLLNEDVIKKVRDLMANRKKKSRK